VETTAASAPAAAPPAAVPAPRRHVIAVRLTATERAAWTAAREHSPWSDLACWAREIVADALARHGPGRRPGAAAVRVGVDACQVEHLAARAAALNAATRDSHRLGRVLPGACEHADELALLAVAAEARSRPPAPPAGNDTTGPLRPVPVGERQTHLVNIRLSTDERGRWQAAAAADGHPRTSGWVRSLVGALCGLAVPAPVPVAPPGLVQVRRQLAGAVTNLAQLADLAAAGDDARVDALAAAHEQTQATLIALHRAPARGPE
jgi:hypothetical protein